LTFYDLTKWTKHSLKDPDRPVGAPSQASGEPEHEHMFNRCSTGASLHTCAQLCLLAGVPDQ